MNLQHQFDLEAASALWLPVLLLRLSKLHPLVGAVCQETDIAPR